MISSEVQRTLVKSPPELWAELSDPAALARHLGELGEIRIIRTEPESTVEWAAENTTGTVSIKPSGWGTKVTLSVTRETVEEQRVEEPRAPASASEVASEPAAAAEAEPAGTVEGESTAPVEPELSATIEPDETASVASEASATVELEAPALDTEPQLSSALKLEAQPEPRRGFFARLFGRRHRTQPAPSTEAPSTEAQTTEAQTTEAPSTEQPDAPAQRAAPEGAPGQPDAFAAVRQALAPDTFAQAHPFAVVPAGKPRPDEIASERLEVEQLADAGHAERLDDISAELMAAESVAAEQVSAEEVTAVLTAVLDRLGAAHHRPFSRS